MKPKEDDTMWYWYVIGAVTLVMNILAFCLMASDKRKARKGLWRIQ